MTYDEFSRYLGKAGWTAKEFALLLKKATQFMQKVDEFPMSYELLLL